jgi:hypothetical protein
LCFGASEIPEGKSAEDLFADALEAGDYTPVTALFDRLKHADYRIAHRLASDEESNSYPSFLEIFAGSHFLTFNYDSLPESILFRLGLWFPHDGFGVPVQARMQEGKEGLALRRSTTHVLHLHGSLYIRTSESEIRRETGETMAWLKLRDQPLYSFDPDSVPGNFLPFERPFSATDARDQIVAPVPDKSHGLKHVFIKEMYTKAAAFIRTSEIVVAIGYSFSPHDRASYQTLLDVLAESERRKLVVVSPDAEKIVDALRIGGFRDLIIEPVPLTFKEWAEDSFGGFQRQCADGPARSEPCTSASSSASSVLSLI